MEGVTDIRIDEHFVIHVLDNRLPQAQCSQALTPLPETLRALLERYLLSLLKPHYRRKRFGRFRPESAVLGAYQELLASWQPSHGMATADFLRVSQRLAVSLFDTMRQESHNGVHARPGDITPGDLLVGLFYSQAPEAAIVPYLFLIKVDLESALQRQVRPLAQGGIQTVLTPCDGLLPKFTSAHVHKAALIRSSNDPSTYDVLMTDPQGGKQGIARFFAEDFLQAEPFQTPTEQAELLFVRTYAWVQEHENTLSPREQQEVLQSVRTLITERATTAEPLVPQELVVALPLSEPRPEQAVQELRQSFQATLVASEENGHSLPPERQLILRVVPPRLASTRVTYQLDGGVQLSGEQEALERLFASPPRRVGNATEFTIRTATFRPVL
jgi:hypothetical protein